MIDWGHESNGAVWCRAVLVVDFGWCKVVGLRDHELVRQLCFGHKTGCAVVAELPDQEVEETFV